MARKLLFLDAKSLTLEEWLAHVTTPKHKRKVKIDDFQFPTDKHRDKFLESIHTRSELTIKLLLRSLLMESGTLGVDEIQRHQLSLLPREKLADLITKYEFIRRLVESPLLAWEGITWILDLLPHHPAQALDVIDAYFMAHISCLPDGRINGLSDAEAIIRRRYIHIENPREALLSLRPDEFEFLVGSLYEELGYEATVTQKSRDGGVDVKAQRIDAGGRALILIQCKRYEKVVRVSAVRELMGVVSRQQANKGVIVATCGFTRPAMEEANSTSMIELIDFSMLNKLLNQYMGAKWPDTITYRIRRMQLASMKSQVKDDI